MTRKSKKETFDELVEEYRAAKLKQPCPKCRAAACEPCTNYKGQRKATCRQRPTAEPVVIDPEPPQLPAFPDGPARQGSLYEFLPDDESEVPK